MTRLAFSAHWASFLPQIGVFADSTSNIIADYKRQKYGKHGEQYVN